MLSSLRQRTYEISFMCVMKGSYWKLELIRELDAPIWSGTSTVELFLSRHKPERRRLSQQLRNSGREPFRWLDILLLRERVHLTLTLPLKTSTRDSHCKSCGNGPLDKTWVLPARTCWQYSSCRTFSSRA